MIDLEWPYSLPNFSNSMILLKRAVLLLESFTWPPLNQIHSKMVSINYDYLNHQSGTILVTINAGVHLNYYFGDAVSHIMRYKCKIYFVCDQANEIVGPDFEHLKDNYDAHIHIKTKYAC